MDINGRYFFIRLFFLICFTGTLQANAQRPIMGITASGYRAPGGGFACTGTDSLGNSWDTDACKFITATGITGNTKTTAINVLVKQLKDSSLWTLADAVYPITGGTAYAHKYNLKDTGSSFNLTFSGSWTHSSTGMLPDGSTAYANTHWVPSTQSDPTSKTSSGGVYLRTDVNGTYVDMGAKDASTYYFQIFSSLGYSFYGQPNENNRIPESISTNTSPGSRGWFFINRKDINNTWIQWNITQSSLFYSSLTTDAQAPTVSVYLGAENISGTATYFSPREIAFGWLGKTLTEAQGFTLQIIINNYETILARNISY